MQLVFPLSMLLCFVFSSFFVSGQLLAQTQEARVLVADLTQDIALMDRQIRSLSLEVEILKEKNEKAINGPSYRALEMKLDQISNDLNALKSDLSTQEKRIKQEVLDKLAKQMNIYVSNINSQLGYPNIAEKNSDAKNVFPNNYPKSGVSYEVQPGDTLSEIAVRFGSRVEHIQNANQINDPSKDLRVGDIIFIPLTEE